MHRPVRLALLVCAAALATGSSRTSAQTPTLTPSTTPVFGGGTLVVDPMSRMDALLDVDLDGRMDAVGFWNSLADGTKGELRWFRGDGKGGMQAHTLLGNIPIPLYNPNADIVLGDWNGDGHRDFALYELGGRLHFYTSDKSGPIFVQSVTLPLQDDITGVVGLDCNGDKRDDVAVLTGSRFYVFLNSGQVPDTLGHARADGGAGLRLIDVDADGARDVMYIRAGAEAQLLKIHRKSPWVSERKDAVTEHARFALGKLLPAMPACGDVDNDGDEDAVIFFADRNYLVLRHGNGAVFTLEPWATGGPATALADIDGDGDLDGICCGGGGGGTKSGRPNNAVVQYEYCINQGGGRFAVSNSAPNMGARHIAGAADMNGDGRVDLVAGRGVLFDRRGYAEPMADWIRPRNISYVNVHAVADADGDGDVEVYTPFLTQGYRNPGDGRLQWAPPVLPDAPANAYFSTSAFYRGDWDGDGDEDILLGTTSRSGPFLGMTLLRNQDGERFVDAGIVAPAGDSFHPFYKNRPFATDYFAIDLDSDGLTDLVTYQTSTVPTRAFVNKGQGRFVEITHGLYTTLRFARDLNGDGYPDLVARVFNGAIDVYWGRKDGTPSAPTRIDVGFPVIAFDLADHDGDGDLDVYATIDKEVALFLNQGVGGFSKVSLFPRTSSTATTLELIDLDADGRKDLYVYPASTNLTAWVAVRDAGNGFAFMEQVMLGGFKAPFDADGDGDIDLVGDWVQHNLTHHGPTRGETLQYGTATAGSSGVRPLLSATGPFRPGEMSALRLRNGPGGTLALLVAGASPVDLTDFPWVGTNTYVWPQPFQALVRLGGPAGVPAAGSLSASLRLPPGVAGTTICFQAYLLDPSAPNSLISSNGVVVQYGL